MRTIPNITNISATCFDRAISCLNYPIIIEADDNYKVEAFIKGSSPFAYNVSLERQNLMIFGSCSCPAFEKFDECKHIALLLLKEDLAFNQGLTPSLEYFYRPMRDPDEYFLDQNDSKNDITEKKSSHMVKSMMLDTMKRHTVLEFNSKEQRLKDKKIAQFYTPNEQSRKVACLHYYVSKNIFDGYDSDTYRLELKCSSILKSGKLGKPKKVNLNAAVIAQLPRDDREIAKEITAFADWRETYYGNDPSYFDSAYIPVDELRKLIPKFAATGRLYFSSTGYYGRSSDGDISAVKFDATMGEIYFKVTPNSKEHRLDFVVHNGASNKDLAWDIKELCENAQVNESLGVLFHKGQLYSYLPLIPFPFVIDIILVDETFSQQEWEIARDFILSNYSAKAIGPDFFGLEKVSVSPQIQIYLKWCNDDNIAGLIVEDRPEKEPDKIIDIDHHVRDEFIANIPENFKTNIINSDEFEFSGTKLFDFVKYFQQEGVDVLLDKKKVHSSQSFSLKVSSGINWFEIDSNVEIGDESFDLGQLLKKINFNSKMIELKNGEQGVIPEQWIQKVKKLVELSKKQGDKLLIHPSKVLLLNDFDFSSLHLDQSVRQWMDKVTNFDKIKKEAPSRKFKGELRDYQKFSLGWFRFIDDLGVGGCLADDMGLGKTIQMISYLQKKLKKEKALIVCPKSLTTNWKREFERFAPEFEVDIWESGSFKDDYLNPSILLVSYQLLTRHIKELHDRDLTYRYLILDEAQTIKNPHSLSHKAVSSISAQSRFALTGTPIENHVGELMSIFNFLSPGLFQGRSLKGKDFKMEDMNFLRPFLLRRIKEDVLPELPEKTVQVIYCDQEKKERAYYQKLSLAISENVFQVDEQGRTKKNPMAILAGLTKLRQASCHVGLIEDDLMDAPIGKVLQLKEMLFEILEEGHKVIIFSQFTSLLKTVRSQLHFNDDNSCYLDGQTRKRDKVISEFKEIEEKKVFFISLKAGGVGLNLTTASYCFLLDPWWNPAAESQAIDRIYRIGQEHPVHAYRMITKGTVEEKVLMLQEQKMKLADQILASNENFIQNLSQDDLKFLIE